MVSQDSLALAILVFALLGMLRFRSEHSFLLRRLKHIFLLSVAAIFGSSFYLTFLLYQNWQIGSVAKFFLPPYQNLNYFFSYAGYLFFVPWLVSLLAAIVIPRIAERLNRKYSELFFYDEEFWFMRLGIFLVGYPGLWFYAALVLLFGLLLSTLYFLLSRDRAPLYWLWLPLAIATVILTQWIIPNSILKFFAL